MTTRRKLGMPSAPPNMPPGMSEWIEAATERLETMLGERVRQDAGDRVPTKQDMIDAGITGASDLFSSE